MVAAVDSAGRRLRVFYQPMFMDFQVRMRIVVGGGGHGLQHSCSLRAYGAWKALSVLRARVGGAGGGDDRDHRSAGFRQLGRAVEMGSTRGGGAGVISGGRRGRGADYGMGGWVLEPVGLADPAWLWRYWNFYGTRTLRRTVYRDRHLAGHRNPEWRRGRTQESCAGSSDLTSFSEESLA